MQMRSAISDDFSECALIYKANQLDFDSALRRLEFFPAKPINVLIENCYLAAPLDPCLSFPVRNGFSDLIVFMNSKQNQMLAMPTGVRTRAESQHRDRYRLR